MGDLKSGPAVTRSQRQGNASVLQEPHSQRNMSVYSMRVVIEVDRAFRIPVVQSQDLLSTQPCFCHQGVEASSQDVKGWLVFGACRQHLAQEMVRHVMCFLLFGTTEGHHALDTDGRQHLQEGGMPCGSHASRTEGAPARSPWPNRYILLSDGSPLFHFAHPFNMSFISTIDIRGSNKKDNEWQIQRLVLQGLFAESQWSGPRFRWSGPQCSPWGHRRKAQE